LGYVANEIDITCNEGVTAEQVEELIKKYNGKIVYDKSLLILCSLIISKFSLRDHIAHKTS